MSLLSNIVRLFLNCLCSSVILNNRHFRRIIQQKGNASLIYPSIDGTAKNIFTSAFLQFLHSYWKILLHGLLSRNVLFYAFLMKFSTLSFPEKTRCTPMVSFTRYLCYLVNPLRRSFNDPFNLQNFYLVNITRYRKRKLTDYNSFANDPRPFENWHHF